jgi:hypothetical protein
MIVSRHHTLCTTTACAAGLGSDCCPVKIMMTGFKPDLTSMTRSGRAEAYEYTCHVHLDDKAEHSSKQLTECVYSRADVDRHIPLSLRVIHR